MSQSTAYNGTQRIGPWPAWDLMTIGYNLSPDSEYADYHAAQSNSITVALHYYGCWALLRYQRRMAAQHAAVMAGAWRSIRVEGVYVYHLFGHLV